MNKTIVVALGGNAIKQAHEKGTSEEQFKNVNIACKAIMNLIKEGYEVVITHGNGPQSGNLMVQQEAAKDKVPAMPMDVVGAMTQGQIGYMIQQTLQNLIALEGKEIPVATVVTQVVVSKDDPDFEDPSKPVGNFFTKEEAEALAARDGYVINPPPGKEYLEKKMAGYVIKKVKPTGDRPFRRVVPSPDPIRVAEAKAIKALVEAGTVVIASGGGGVPVMEKDGGILAGLDGVIDKDKAGERLAEAVNADIFLVLTDIEVAYLNFGKEDQKPVNKMTVAEAKRYLEEGHFLAGSMGPKVLACIRFLEEAKGEKAIITSLDKVRDALKGKTGTVIVP
ncbi:MAG: carbamate kinase [Methanomicrobia archaeon]|nr:carbamate kinase [Methanomicrobia archaeon]